MWSPHVEIWLGSKQPSALPIGAYLLNEMEIEMASDNLRRIDQVDAGMGSMQHSCVGYNCSLNRISHEHESGATMALKRNAMFAFAAGPTTTRPPEIFTSLSLA